MMLPTSELQTPATSPWKRFTHTYAWPIARNVIGWLLIAASLVLGPAVPGPGGIPLFLIGFAMVSFPGKRRLTARVFRGRPIGHPHRIYYLICLAISLLLPSVATFLFALDSHLRLWLAKAVSDPRLVVLCAYLALVAICWTALRLLPAILNLCLPWVPPIRRKIRPWMRQRGMHLLPPRHRDRQAPFDSGHRPRDEILEFTERFSAQFLPLWRRARRWTLYVACVGLAVLVVWLTLRHR
jgi:hypothetical protein